MCLPVPDLWHHVKYLGCNRSKILSYKADYKSAVCDFFSALVQQSSEVPPVLVLRSTSESCLSNSTLVFLRRWLHSYVRSIQLKISTVPFYFTFKTLVANIASP